MSRQPQQSVQPDDEADMCVVGPAPPLAIPVPRYPSREVGEAGYAAMLQFIAKAPLPSLESLVQGSIISSRDRRSDTLGSRAGSDSGRPAAARSSRVALTSDAAGKPRDPK